MSAKVVHCQLERQEAENREKMLARAEMVHKKYGGIGVPRYLSNRLVAYAN